MNPSRSCDRPLASHAAAFAGIILGAALLGGLSARAASAQARLPPALELRVPKAPTVATGEGGSFLAYELHVTNFATQPMTRRLARG